MDPFDITKYLDIALRRKYWIIIPFLLSALGGFSYFLIAPKIYEAQTLILVQPQRVPESFVQSIVSTSVEDRLRTITQQVTSRTNLEKITKEYYSAAELNHFLDVDSMVTALRGKISINVTGGNRGHETSTFTIVFRDENPETVMKVTNALASNFITENLKIREAQALGTSSFLADELEAVKKRLVDKEEELKTYREKYMGALPEHLDTNLTILQRLQGKLDQLHSNLRDAENRKIVVQAQITEQSPNRSELIISSTGGVREGTDIKSLRNQLASLEAKYTSKHPDIIRLKETIANLEHERLESKGNPASTDKASTLQEANPIVLGQLRDIENEIASFKNEIQKTLSQISAYERKVEETPKREQELLSLNRDYGNLRELYSSLLNRKLEAQIAVSMEKKQKGEQFMVIDPAKVPTRPVKPDIRKVLLLTLFLGLGMGCGLAYMKEIMDTSFKSPEEVENELKLPVLVSVPFFYTNRETKAHRIKEGLKATAVGVAFVLSTVGIVLATKGVDTTVTFAKTFLANLGVI